MKNLLKSVLIYATALVGGVLVLALRVLGWFAFLGAALIGIFWLVGELSVDGWILAVVAIVGLVFLAVADRILRLAGEES